tara:strand:+ start:7400 stop:8152 length:753 start_codon:yes stop_codon:yes gene_type:complete
MNDLEIETLITSRCCNVLIHGCVSSGKRKLVSKCMNVIDKTYSSTSFTSSEINNKLYICRKSVTLFEFDASLNNFNDVVFKMLETFISGEYLIKTCNVIIYNVHCIKKSYQKQLTKLIDKYQNTFYIFTATNTTSIDINFLSRVLCLGKRKMIHNNIYTIKAMNPLINLLTSKEVNKTIIFQIRTECYALLKNCFTFNEIAKELLKYFRHEHRILEIIHEIEMQHTKGNKTIFYLEYMCICIMRVINNMV